MGRVAITGIASFLGGRILRRLVETRGADAVIAIDVSSPPAALAGVRHQLVDLTLPGADRRVLEVLEQERVSEVVHVAYFTSPRRDGSYAHELESIGTLHLAAAAAAAGVRHLVLRSFTAVYGAHGRNPSFLTETHPAASGSPLGWVRDKIEAEQHAGSFSRRYPELGLSILRFAPLMGPGIHNFYTRILAKRVVPVLLGYDPQVQLLHPADAVAAVERVLERGPAAVVNVVPRSALTLLTALHLAEKVVVPVPHPVAYATAELLWGSGLGEAPGAFLDYVRYPFVADGAKASRELGFVATYGSRDALLDYLAYRYPDTERQVAAPA